MSDGISEKIRQLQIPITFHKSAFKKGKRVYADDGDEKPPSWEWTLLITLMAVAVGGYIYFRQISGQLF